MYKVGDKVEIMGKKWVVDDVLLSLRTEHTKENKNAPTRFITVNANELKNQKQQ